MAAINLDVSGVMMSVDSPLAEVRSAIAALSRIEAGLYEVSRVLEINAHYPLPPCDTPITEHRRLHKSGTAPKIDSNPALQSFILARADRLTFHQIAAAIAEHFPPDQHVHPATVHRWVQKRRNV